MTTDQAVSRQASHENLIQDLLNAIEAIDLAFVDDSNVSSDSRIGRAILAAREVWLRAEGFK